MGLQSREKAMETLSDMEKELKALRQRADKLDSTQFYFAFDRLRKFVDLAEAEAFEGWMTMHAAEAAEAVKADD